MNGTVNYSLQLIDISLCVVLRWRNDYINTRMNKKRHQLMQIFSILILSTSLVLAGNAPLDGKVLKEGASGVKGVCDEARAWQVWADYAKEKIAPSAASYRYNLGKGLFEDIPGFRELDDLEKAKDKWTNDYVEDFVWLGNPSMRIYNAAEGRWVPVTAGKAYLKAEGLSIGNFYII